VVSRDVLVDAESPSGERDEHRGRRSKAGSCECRFTDQDDLLSQLIPDAPTNFDGIPLGCPPDEALDTVRLLDAITRSAATGRIARVA
jgi:hypothetical protein